MKKGILISFSILFIFGVVSCERKEVKNKIIEGVPVDTTSSVIPAKAIQEMMLLKRDAFGIVVPIINRLPLSGATFSEITGPDNQNQYTFTFRHEKYGEANFTLLFFSAAGSVIDPISAQTSTQSLKSVSIKTVGSSDLFQYSENLILTLATAGDVESTKRIQGTSSFNGSGFSLLFRFDHPGVATNFEGFIQGIFTGSGTGPTGNPTSLSLEYSSDHSANGTLSWETFSGGIHFNNAGEGTLVTSQSIIFID